MQGQIGDRGAGVKRQHAPPGHGSCGKRRGRGADRAFPCALRLGVDHDRSERFRRQTRAEPAFARGRVAGLVPRRQRAIIRPSTPSKGTRMSVRHAPEARPVSGRRRPDRATAHGVFLKRPVWALGRGRITSATVVAVHEDKTSRGARVLNAGQAVSSTRGRPGLAEEGTRRAICASVSQQRSERFPRAFSGRGLRHPLKSVSSDLDPRAKLEERRSSPLSAMPEAPGETQNPRPGGTGRGQKASDKAAGHAVRRVSSVALSVVTSACSTSRIDSTPTVRSPSSTR